MITLGSHSSVVARESSNENIFIYG